MLSEVQHSLLKHMRNGEPYPSYADRWATLSVLSHREFIVWCSAEEDHPETGKKLWTGGYFITPAGRAALENRDG